jgi:two-component system LytT family response regulator
MKIRTLIVDDEPLARSRLRQLLQGEPEIEIIGECADGHEAVAAFEKDRPELVFLDVQMPELDGFGVLEAVAAPLLPVIVFVTAHDRFALRAFEVHAVDYLLKPFDRERFQKALGRAVDQVKGRDSNALRERQLALLADWQSSQLAVKAGGSVTWVKLDAIDWIGSADNYAELHVGGKSHLLRETLSALENRLSPERFMRISRSAIVNIQRIKALRRLFYGGYEVILADGTRLTLSRRQRAKLKQLSPA